jgi:F-type H+-transporting ATPase subunit b
MEGLTSLGINLPVLIAQIINFGLLFLLLRVVAFKPLMKMFDKRASIIKESVEQTERIKEEAARAEEEARKRIEQASK